MLPPLTKLKGVALDLLFPQFCVGCGREGAFLCPDCLHTLPYISTSVCPRCGIPEAGGNMCRSCIGWQASIDGIRAPFRFEGVIREAVHQLKYRNLRAIVPVLACMLHEFLRENPLQSDILVPVPLHPKRLRERGYNQSGLLARELSRLTEIPVDENNLVRTRHSVPQAGTASVAERHQNVIGLFEARTAVFQDKHVLVIDDVTTTGATLNACAVALKQAGAASVNGLALAKEI